MIISCMKKNLFKVLLLVKRLAKKHAFLRKLLLFMTSTTTNLPLGEHITVIGAE